MIFSVLLRLGAILAIPFGGPSPNVLEEPPRPDAASDGVYFQVNSAESQAQSDNGSPDTGTRNDQAQNSPASKPSPTQPSNRVPTSKPCMTCEACGAPIVGEVPGTQAGGRQLCAKCRAREAKSQECSIWETPQLTGHWGGARTRLG